MLSASWGVMGTLSAVSVRTLCLWLLGGLPSRLRTQRFPFPECLLHAGHCAHCSFPVLSLVSPSSSCGIIFILPSDENEALQASDSCLRSQDLNPGPRPRDQARLHLHALVLSLLADRPLALEGNTLSPLCPQRTTKTTSPPTSPDRPLLSWRRSGSPKPRGTAPTTVGLSQADARNWWKSAPAPPPVCSPLPPPHPCTARGDARPRVTVCQALSHLRRSWWEFDLMGWTEEAWGDVIYLWSENTNSWQNQS